MSLNIESQSPRANAHLNLGLDRLRLFQERPDDRAILNEAEEDLNRAVEEDPSFLPAVYYRGIARNLKGENDLAISDLTRVVESKPPFTAEARFNLGIARFHKYHRSDLQEAVAQFQAVLTSNAISDELRLQTMASLAQVHGQLMIQKNPEQPDREQVALHFFKVLGAETEIRLLLKGQTPDASIKWRIENAVGLGYMFASDYYGSIVVQNGTVWHRPALVLEARKHFENADNASPKNWAILCNLGSIWMRTSYWSSHDNLEENSQESFERSKYFLERVVDKIRPNYGFALYELGRLHRINAKFAEALEWFKRSEDVPETKRDVSKSTLDREIKRAREQKSIFP